MHKTLGQRDPAAAFPLAHARDDAPYGFGGAYTIPGTATAALGVLLAITILAAADRVGRRDTAPESAASLEPA